MLKKFAPSQKKKRKLTESQIISYPTPNQEGCIEEDMPYPESEHTINGIESSEENSLSSSEEDSIEDYIKHLEDIRSLSDQDFAWLKEDIRSQSIDFQM